MMGSRRSPFQYSAIDNAKRQEELQKRFGLHSPKKNMLVDLMNPISHSHRHSSPSGSPRLQHRIPVFNEEASEMPMSIDSNPKPRVRVIPIEIEDADSTTKRHRCASSPAKKAETCECEFQTDERPLHPKQCPPSSKAPTVKNIPIKVEQRKPNKLNIEFCSPAKAIPPSKTKNASPKVKSSGKENVKKSGCATSKSPKEQSHPEKVDVPQPELQPPTESHYSVALRKIDFVIERLKGYETEVAAFAGTVKDKKYKYLDEMLTRCMLDLDDVETLGKEDIRLARKAAVKKVQACVDLLETKVNAASQQPSEDNSTIDSTVLDKEPADQQIVETDEQPVTRTNLTGTDVEMKGLHEKPAEAKVNECVEQPIVKTTEILPVMSIEHPFLETTNATKVDFEMDKSKDSVEITSDADVEEAVDNALYVKLKIRNFM